MGHVLRSTASPRAFRAPASVGRQPPGRARSWHARPRAQRVRPARTARFTRPPAADLEISTVLHPNSSGLALVHGRQTKRALLDRVRRPRVPARVSRRPSCSRRTTCPPRSGASSGCAAPAVRRSCDRGWDNGLQQTRGVVFALPSIYQALFQFRQAQGGWVILRVANEFAVQRQRGLATGSDSPHRDFQRRARVAPPLRADIPLHHVLELPHLGDPTWRTGNRG